MLMWTKSKEELRLCKEWLENPYKNPETGRRIEKNGKKYMEWKERCQKCGLKSKPVLSKITMDKNKCREFAKNPSINPKTGNKIKIGGPMYKKLLKECKECIKNPEILNLEGDYPIPDQDGLVLVKRCGNRNYIVRTTAERRVYSPLNNYADNPLTKVYFKHTWDYKNGHYKPIFIGKKEPLEKVRTVKKQETKTDSKYLIDDILNIFIK